MTFRNLLGAFTGILLLSFLAGCGGESKPDLAPAGQKSAQEMLDGMRLKQLTKGLELTDEQQAKVKELYDAEGKEIAGIRADANVSLTDQNVKIAGLHKETNGKIKPLLNPTQLEKFEVMLTKAEKGKRKN